MRRTSAAAGSLLFPLVAPGVVVGLVPSLIVVGVALTSFVRWYEEPTLL